MTEVKKYLVGGAVRDHLLGVPSKDHDYVVVGLDFDGLRDWLIADGYEIVQETPAFYTIKARKTREVLDFVVPRREGPYSDGRHPDWVEKGTLEDDLRRRDFTVNAMAMDDDGKIIDMFNGQRHLAERKLVTVGKPMVRFNEDPLRAYRAVRFAVTKGLTIDAKVDAALLRPDLIELVRSPALSVERIREELVKAFSKDTILTMHLLNRYMGLTVAAVEKGLWFKPTSEKVSGGPKGPKQNLPPASNGCTCECHFIPGVNHIVACCYLEQES